MHGSMSFGGQVLMGADLPSDRYEKPQGFSLSLHIPRTRDAERVFGALAEDGTVVFPLSPTFWAARFGMLVDRFGIPWLINSEGADAAGE
jgi:PhnB protein